MKNMISKKTNKEYLVKKGDNTYFICQKDEFKIFEWLLPYMKSVNIKIQLTERSNNAAKNIYIKWESR